MDPQQEPLEPTAAEEIFAVYTWTTGGVCYRCDRADVETAVVGSVGPDDGTVEVKACPSCVLLLERDRERAAHRYGWPYEPGTPVERR